MISAENKTLLKKKATEPVTDADKEHLQELQRNEQLTRDSYKLAKRYAMVRRQLDKKYYRIQ